MKFNTSINVIIEPVYWKSYPAIAYGYNNTKIETIRVDSEKILDLSNNFEPGENYIWIDFFNKSSNDSNAAGDMAVKIKKIVIENMSLYRFIWAAKYTPKYPKDWLANNPNQPEIIQSAEYLGWNGRWQLSFTTPIFTWIHQLENLGWLYEP